MITDQQTATMHSRYYFKFYFKFYNCRGYWAYCSHALHCTLLCMALSIGGGGACAQLSVFFVSNQGHQPAYKPSAHTPPHHIYSRLIALSNPALIKPRLASPDQLYYISDLLSSVFIPLLLAAAHSHTYWPVFVLIALPLLQSVSLPFSCWCLCPPAAHRHHAAAFGPI